MNKQTNKPQERWEPACDKLHADAEGDHVLVSRDGYEQQPHWPEKELSTWSFWERGDGVKGLFAMSELLWIVGETHGYPLKHSVERDCENDEKASKSCLGGRWGFETKLPTSNPESPVPAWGIAWEWPWPDSSMMFPSTTPFSGFSCLEAALQRLIRMCVTWTGSFVDWAPGLLDLFCSIFPTSSTK